MIYVPVIRNLLSPEQPVFSEDDLPEEDDEELLDSEDGEESGSSDDFLVEETRRESTDPTANIFGSISSFGGSLGSPDPGTTRRESRLQGVLQFGDERMAIVSGQLVLPGDPVGESWVEKIHRRSVILNSGRGTTTLKFEHPDSRSPRSSPDSSTDSGEDGPST